MLNSFITNSLKQATDQIKELCVDSSYKVKFGLHFNLTEGNPLSECASLTNVDGSFFGKGGFWSSHEKIDSRESLDLILVINEDIIINNKLIRDHQKISI